MATSRLCSIPDCGKPARSRGWCSAHYHRWQRYGDPTGGLQKRPASCGYPGCDRRHYSLGWCVTHYSRWRAHGDPSVKLTGKSLEERLMRRVVPRRDTGCWEWTGATGHGGHGVIAIKYSKGRATQVSVTSRVSWTLYRGAIPDGLFVLHRCDNPRCVNPDHLFLGSQADNVADMINKGRNAIGKQLPQCKLSDRSVLAIRADPRPQKEIARDYGITRSYVSELKSRQKRRYLSTRR